MSGESKSALLSAYRTIEALEERLKQAAPVEAEPVAIVGIGCRFPGGVRDPESFWKLLRDGVDATRELPEGRWDRKAWSDAVYVDRGGYLDEDPGLFDAEFFGVSPREAAAMDPQQRLLLRVAWEALEDARIPADELRESETGVYVGLMTNDYARLSVEYDTARHDGLYLGGGTGLGFPAGRLSYTLGLHGPSMVVATECSSSLVALHLAANALRAGECGLAMAGGVNLILSPEPTVMLSRMRALAADGRCKSFAAGADGYARGEGCGVVVLQRLSEAQRDGRRIYAVVHGSAVNHDGPSGGLTIPNGPAQERVIRKALAQARVSAASVAHVEAHGTGTALGDPIEARALGNIWSEAGGRVAVGSVKTNIGHAEAAAGIAGAIKTALALYHGTMPASLHCGTPSPHVPWRDVPVEVVTAARAWPADRPFAGVSSFGLSGINAHAVMGKAPEAGAVGARPRRSHWLLPVSARSEAARAELAERYADRLDAEWWRVCAAASRGRAQLEHRLAVNASSKDEAVRLLRGGAHARKAMGRAGVRAESGVSFLFTGQGSQYACMGLALYEAEPSFRETLDRCARVLDAELGKPLLEVLFPPPGFSTPIDRTEFTQPALFALEYALAQLWMRWGVRPRDVAGHSIGEVAAACVAEWFPLEDGLRFAARRGRLMGSLPAATGAMAAVFADVAEVAPLLTPEIAVAAVNAPGNVVIAGERDALGHVVERLESRGIASAGLNVSHAFHSAALDPILPELEKAAREVRFRSGSARVVSSLTGTWAGAEMATPEYWARQARETVRFADAARTLYGAGRRHFVEIGPKAVLSRLGAATVGDRECRWLPSLAEGRPDFEVLNDSVAALWVDGFAIDWKAFQPDAGAGVELPLYPFQEKRHWLEERRRTSVAVVAPETMLGRRIDSPLAAAQYESSIGIPERPWLGEHRAMGEALLPATAYLEMALGLGDAVADVRIESACRLPAERSLRVQTVVEGDGFAIYSRDGEGEWTRHCTGRIVEVDRQAGESLAAVRARVAEPVDVAGFYADASARGVEYGPAFRAVGALWRGSGEALSRVSAGSLTVLLDGVLQTAGAVLHDEGEAFLPVAVGEVWCGAGRGLKAPRGINPAVQTAVWAHARQVSAAAAGVTFDYTLYDEAGEVVGEIRGLVAQQARSRDAAPSGWVYSTKWIPAGLESGWVGVDPERLAEAAEGEARRWLERAEIAEYRETQAALNARAASWMARALGTGPVVAEHRRLWERMRGIAAAGEAPCGRSAAFEIVDRCGAALPAVLRGEVDGLALLFPSDGGTAATRLYETDLAGLAANAMAREALRSVVAGLPAGRKIRVLEAGAGTGGSTSHLLSALPPERSEYWFTDVSSYFTEQAKEKLRSYGSVRTHLFDITREPAAQGLEEGSFDVVVAANVVHAVGDARGALRNLERLVAPGGVLLLIEATRPAAWLDVTFGLTKGWWSFADGRSYPLMAAGEWREAARECGFGAVSTHAVEGQTLVVASKAAGVVGAAAGTWVLMADRGGVGDGLAERLRADGCEVVTVADGAAYREVGPGRFEMSATSSSEMQLFSMERLGGPVAGIVYLWSLDRGASPDFEACLPLLNLLRNLARGERMPRVWVATRSAVGVAAADEVAGWDGAQLWGLAQSARLEHPALGLTCVDLDGREAAAALYAEVASGSDERHVAYRGGARWAGRLTRAARESEALSAPAGAFRLETKARGDLDGLALCAVERRAPGAGEVEIEVRAAGLNFLDVLDALGALPFERGWLGGECSGVVTAVGEGVTEFAAGDAVVALAAGAFGSHAVADARVTVRKPERLTWAEAAGFPVAFLTARLALADVRSGERVLVHAVSGGTGMAAWQLARRAGAEVLGTASPAKWERLRAMGIDAMNSRTVSFASESLARTYGRGVDVVLNALTGEFIPAGLRALAPRGRFLEIGKAEIWSGEQVAAVREDVAYRVVDFYAFSRENPEAAGAMLREIAAAFENGELAPLPTEEFGVGRAVEAFRTMQSARHVGKVVLTMPAGREGAVLIVGGSSGLGLLTAEWLAERGAGEIVLASRRAADVTALRARGVRAEAVECDVVDRGAVERLLAGRRWRGVVHAAGVLHDSVIVQMEWPMFRRVLEVKAQGLWNLHELTAGMGLEFFVAYSSIASVFGSAGQTNHAAANGFVDGLMAWRRRQGLPGVSINWGPWEELGGAARLSGTAKERQRQSGIGTIGTRQGRALLGRVWEMGGLVAPIDWARIAGRVEGQAFYEEFLQAEAAPRPRVVGRKGIEALVVEELRAVLGHGDGWTPDEEQGFFGLGMDSLTSLELRNRLERAMGVKLPVTVLFDHPSPQRLAEYLAGLAEPAGVVAEAEEDLETLAALLEAKLASMEAMETE